MDKPPVIVQVDDCTSHPIFAERAIRKAAPGANVITLSSGERAIEHLSLCGSKYPLPDLVLVDREMPGGLDGFGTAKALRCLPHLRPVGILIVSGSDLDEHKAQAREAGADGYIIKPTDQNGYHLLAQSVQAWRQNKQSWRCNGGASSELELSAESQPVGLVQPTMCATAIPVMPAAFIAQEPSLLQQMMQFFSGLQRQAREDARQMLDPVALAISEACRKHHIPEAHARGVKKDQVTVANRKAVIFHLMDAGYSDPVILDNFQLSERHLERLRAEWHVKVGGVVSVGKN